MTETITVDEELVISFQFVAFNIECNDHLTIMDGDGTALMEKGCGTTLPANITTRSNIVNLMFSTDSSQTMTGWHVIWSASEYWYFCFQMITICYWLCKLYSLALCQISLKLPDI